MHTRRAILATLATVSLAGCSGEGNNSDEESSNSGENGDTEENGSENGDETMTVSDGQSFSGTGGELVEGISLAAGIVIVDAAFRGDGNHNIELLRTDGTSTDTRFPQVATEYDGTRVDYLDAGGEFLLDVSTNVEWEIEIGQPRDEPVQSLPLDESGESAQVYGPYEFTGSHRASATTDGPFMQVTLWDRSDGSAEYILQNVQSEDETAFNYEGVAYVDVNQSRPWELLIS